MSTPQQHNRTMLLSYGRKLVQLLTDAQPMMTTESPVDQTAYADVLARVTTLVNRLAMLVGP